MSSSRRVGNRKKDILIIGIGPTQGLHNATFTAEKEYAVNFSKQQKKFCLSLHYHGVNSYLFVNGAEIYKFKPNNSEINVTQLCFGNVSKDFSAHNTKILDFLGMSMIFQSIVIVLVLLIFKILITF